MERELCMQAVFIYTALAARNAPLSQDGLNAMHDVNSLPSRSYPPHVADLAWGLARDALPRETLPKTYAGGGILQFWPQHERSMKLPGAPPGVTLKGHRTTSQCTSGTDIE